MPSRCAAPRFSPSPASRRRIALAAACLTLAACSNASRALPTPAGAPPTPPATATRAPTVTPPAPSATRAPQVRIVPAAAGWVRVNGAIEWVTLMGRPAGAGSDQPVLVARIDPAGADIRVRYEAAAARDVRGWLDAAGADLVINAGYFTDQRVATALVIADGKATGRSYVGYGGMFAIRDGKPALDWLTAKPYAQDRRITQAVQSFPMLVMQGKVAPNLPDDARPSFRSFVALDRGGRVLLGVCQTPAWTLAELAQWLAGVPELNIDSALNLDGGRSTGLWMRGVTDAALSNSIDDVPAVIAVSAAKR